MGGVVSAQKLRRGACRGEKGREGGNPRESGAFLVKVKHAFYRQEDRQEAEKVEKGKINQGSWGGRTEARAAILLGRLEKRRKCKKKSTCVRREARARRERRGRVSAIVGPQRKGSMTKLLRNANGSVCSG